MPLFEYVCKSCGNRVEVLQSSDEEPPSCQNCGSQDMQKAFSTFAIGGRSCPGIGACERWPEGAPAECPPGRCCGIGDGAD